MMGRRMGEDGDGDFEEDSGSGIIITGWLRPVETSLFEGRYVANPVVGFS
jgi:hypothetical protein